MAKSFQICLGVLSGIVLGSFVEALAYDSNEEHMLRIPFAGSVIGMLVGGCAGGILGGVFISRMVKYTLLGLAAGAIVGMIAGYCSAKALTSARGSTANSTKRQGIAKANCIVTGMLVGSLFGSTAGLILSTRPSIPNNSRKQQIDD